MIDEFHACGDAQSLGHWPHQRLIDLAAPCKYQLPRSVLQIGPGGRVCENFQEFRTLRGQNLTGEKQLRLGCQDSLMTSVAEAIHPGPSG